MRLISFFFLFFSFSVSTTAQSDFVFHPFVDFLLEKEFISKEEAPQISTDSLLVSIYDVYLKRRNLDRYGRATGFMMLREDSYERIKEVVDRLYSLTLISPTVFKDIQKKVLDGRKRNNSQVATIREIHDVFRYLFEYEKREEKRKEVDVYFKSLKKIGLIEENAKLPDSFSSREQLFPLCKTSIVFIIDSLPESIEDSYRYLYGQMKNLDANLLVSDFEVAIKEEKERFSNSNFAEVKFKNKRQKYFSNNYFRKDYKKSKHYRKIDNRFFAIFNKVLVDQNSSYRIFNIHKMEKGQIGLILLTKEQRQLLQSKKDPVRFKYFDPSWYMIEVNRHEAPFELLNRDEISKCFQNLDSIGLLTHLSDDQKKKVLYKFNNKQLSTCDALFYDTPGVYLNLDWMMAGEVMPFKKAILSLSKYSHGEFLPENIKDDYTPMKKSANVSFELKGKTYESKIPVYGDFYPDEFLAFIDKAIAESELTGKFYLLGGDDSIYSFAYLTKEEYKYLKDNKYIELDTYE